MPTTPNTQRSKVGRPTREASEELLRRVLDVALKEFFLKGFDGTSIEGIAQMVGASKLTLYRHFTNKTGLFLAAMEQMVGQYAVMLSGKIDTSRPPAEVLTELGLFHASVYFTPQTQRLIRTLIAEVPRVKGLPILATRIGDLARGPLEAYLQGLQDRKLADFGDIRRAGIQFANLCMLGQYYLQCDETRAIPDLETQREIVESAVKIFVAGYLQKAK